MNKKFLVSWAVVFIVWMAGSFALHGVWLGESYAALTNLYRPEERQMDLFYLMVIAHVMLAGAFVWIYQRGNENRPWLAQGVRFGIAVAVLAPIPTFMIYYVIQPLPSNLVITQIIGETVLCVILGMVVAFLNKPAARAD